MVQKKIINIHRQVFEFNDKETQEINLILSNALFGYMHSRNIVSKTDQGKIHMLLDPVPNKPGLFKIMALKESSEESTESILANTKMTSSDSLN